MFQKNIIYTLIQDPLARAPLAQSVVLPMHLLEIILSHHLNSNDLN